MQTHVQGPDAVVKAALRSHGGICLDTLCCQAVMPAVPLADPLCANEVFEVALITRGSGICQVLGQAIPCQKGDAFVIPPEIPHKCYVTELGDTLEISRLFLNIHDWLAGEAADGQSPHFCHGVFQEGSLVAYATLNAQAYERVQESLATVAQEVEAAKPDWQAMVRAHLAVLFITLGRYIGEAEHTAAQLSKEWHYAGVAVRMVMESFANSDLKLEFLAETLHISKSHFSRLFKAFTGEPFSAYLRRIRLNHACRLLRETTLTVETVVSCCGLKDIQSFYRNFQEYVGITPHQYRLQGLTAENQTDQLLLREIAEQVERGDGKAVEVLVRQALEEGCGPQRILNEGMLAGMSAVGEKFKNNQVFVPEVLVAVRAMNMGTRVLKPLLMENRPQTSGRVCIGTVQGDLHDIGKNLVKLMMESKGLEVIDLGTDVPPRRFVEAACEQKCQVICCSALLTTTMSIMAEVVREAERTGIRSSVRIMVGGAPVTEAFCQEIGADCYTPDAVSAAEAAQAFCVRADREMKTQKREEF